MMKKNVMFFMGNKDKLGNNWVVVDSSWLLMTGPANLNDVKHFKYVCHPKVYRRRRLHGKIQKKHITYVTERQRIHMRLQVTHVHALLFIKIYAITFLSRMRIFSHDLL